MKRVVAAITVGITGLILMTGCDPKGQSCSHKGDTQTYGSHVYHCKYDPQLGGNTWQ